VDIGTAGRRKISFEVDFHKVDAAKEILGTRSLTATVDAAGSVSKRFDGAGSS
jgi:hypothetical protein